MEKRYSLPVFLNTPVLCYGCPMFWFVLLIVMALVLVLFLLPSCRDEIIRNFREMVEMNRIKAFAEMEGIAREGERSKVQDPRSNGQDRV